MNIFKINFLDKFHKLFTETIKFKKYRALPKAVAVFVHLPMIFVGLVTMVNFLAGALLSYFFKVLQAPFEYLKGLTNQEGKETKAAAQFIIYFISWPLIFAGYVLISFMIIALHIVYAATSIMAYIWSLGGFKFHVFVEKSDNIEKEVNTNYKTWRWVTFISVFYSILFVLILADIIAAVAQYYPEDYIGAVFLSYGFSIWFLTTIILPICVFARAPKTKCCCECESAPVIEITEE